MSKPGRRLRISLESDVTRSLLEASRFAQGVGLDRQDCQAVATAVSELARNILKYAGEGFVLIEEAVDRSRRGIQVTVQDRGPGIPDLEDAMRDHFSSGGTLGLGLPGVKRLMDDFEIESSPGVGTTVVIRKWTRGARDDASPLRSSLARVPRTFSRNSPSAARESEEKETGERARKPSEDLEGAFFVRPCLGERVSGDLAMIERAGRHALLVVVDALGHGTHAHEIATKAGEFLASSWSIDPAPTILGLHSALEGTDGAAVGICVVDIDANSVHYVGVGNTVIRILGRTEKRAFSTPGTVGCQMRTPRVQSLGLGPEDLLLMYSDGLKENFDLVDHPELLSRNPRTLSREIVMRFGKDYDDVSCLVARYVK